jgi:hypothetical protein
MSSCFSWLSAVPGGQNCVVQLRSSMTSVPYNLCSSRMLSSGWYVSLSILLSGVQTVWSSRARPLTPADDCAPGAGARPVARRVKETPPQGMGNACSVSQSKVKKEPSVKPNSLIPMAGATRLELATSGVTGRRSNQTELRPRIRGQRVC